jgi:negative regulator of sigma E activity
MNHWTDRLSAYIDGELGAADRAACAVHLASCPDCRDTATDLAAMKAEARQLPDEGPAVDLWPGVLARLSAPAATGSPAVETAALAWSHRWSFSMGELALAASLLVAVSAGITWLVVTRAPGTDGHGERAVVAVLEPEPGPGDVQPATFADESYDEAVLDLERVVREQRDELDPQAVRVIERNLQAIDEAIREARQALANDPANPFLNSYLVDSRRRKLDLLRRAALLTSVTQGD